MAPVTQREPSSEAVLGFLSFREELRQALGESGTLHKLELGPEPLWSYLSRFIIATNGDVAKAVNQIKEHQEFLKARSMHEAYLWPAERVLGNKCEAIEVNKFYPMYLRGHDRQGHPIIYARAGKIYIKNALKLVDAEEFLSYHCWLRQRMMWMRDMICAEQDGYDTIEQNCVPAQYTVVLDFEGSSMSQVGPTFYSMIQKTMYVDQIFHAERMFRTIFVHTPFLFHAVWRVVKGFMDPDTVAKLRMGRADYKKYLDELIDPAQVPKDYGGLGPPLSDEDYVSHVTERFFQKHKVKQAQCESNDPKAEEGSSGDDLERIQLEYVEKEIKGVDTGNKETLHESKSAGSESQEDKDSVISVVSKSSSVEDQYIPASGPEDAETTDDHAGAAFCTPSSSLEATLGGETTAKLQEKLLQAQLELETFERSHLQENALLRHRLRNSYSPQSKTTDHSDGPSGEIATLQRQIERLSYDLEDTLAKTSSHQRAVSFARTFIEQQQIVEMARDPRIKELLSCQEALATRNRRLRGVLEKACGPGSVEKVLHH